MLRGVLSWLKGDYPLYFTYWLTGIFPGLLFNGGIYTVNYQLEHGAITPDKGFIALLTVTIAYLIYTPLACWATTASAIKYRGLLLWKILAFLVVGKSVLVYIQTLFLLVVEYLNM